MDHMSKEQFVASVALGAAFGVLAATMPVEVERGFGGTRAAIEEVLECGGDNFSVDGSNVVEYSYVSSSRYRV